MKQSFLLLGLAAIITLFTYCGGSKKAQTPPAPAPKVTFEDNLKPIIIAKCSPCHTPGRGQLPSYLTAEVTKKDIEDIIHRISLQPNERGFMPMRQPRLSDTAINLFKQWQTDGFVEK